MDEYISKKMEKVAEMSCFNAQTNLIKLKIRFYRKFNFKFFPPPPKVIEMTITDFIL